jgi:hypothetical protein
MVGSIAPNLHEGSRSEYLAQYFFASFGTAVSVPHQEDSGIDLYCTLMERVGSRAWPRFYFSVQVKSTMDSWQLKDKESVQWLVKHPLPLFLCIVDKKAARIRLYHTSPRFYVWSIPPLPDLLELIPSTDKKGKCTQWEGSTKFSLSAPILDVSVQDLLENESHQQALETLSSWIGFDLENLARIKAGIHSFTMPGEYKTNSTEFPSSITQGVINAPDLTSALEHVRESVSYLSSQLFHKGDLASAVRCAILLRHFFKNDKWRGTHDAQLHRAVNQIIKGDRDYLFRGVDTLNDMIDQRLTGTEMYGSNEEAGQ